MSARMKSWRGAEVTAAVVRNVAKALGEFGLRVEGNSKRELWKKYPESHGVDTGTLRRSIHVAQGGYDWSSDDVEPSSETPERGGRMFDAIVNGRKITIQVGSGMRYALAVHQGHHSFEGYHFLTIGLDKTKKELPEVLSKYRLK
jgi:hypothetical protein